MKPLGIDGWAAPPKQCKGLITDDEGTRRCQNDAIDGGLLCPHCIDGEPDR